MDTKCHFCTMASVRGFFNRIYVLIWKGLIFRFRFWFYSLLEIIIPLLAVIIVLSVKGSTTSGDPEIIPQSISNSSIPKLTYSRVNLFYTPENTFTTSFMEQIQSRNIVISPTKDEDELVSKIQGNNLNPNAGQSLGIVFLGQAKENSPEVTKLEYKLRTIANWNTKDTLPLHWFPGPTPFNIYPYTDSGFAALQLLINNLFISSNSIEHFSIEIQEFPYPQYIEEYSNLFSEILIPILFSGFIILGSRLSYNILNEKQSGIKELQKMMGINSSFLWFGWYINTLIIHLPVIIIMTILLCAWIVEGGPILEFADPLIIFITLLLFISSAVTFIFFITTFITRPMIGMIIVILIWNVLMYVNFTVFWSDNSYLNALFFIKGVQMAFNVILNYESRKVGIKWTNLASDVNGVSVLGIWLMLIFDIVLGAILTWYIDNLMPGKYGVARSWYFPVERLVAKFRHKIGHLENVSQFDDENMIDYEPVPMELEPGIEISQIRKVFGKKVAVDRVNLTIYKNEITVLLGHNGAGKTTLMSMITGLYSPTEGTIKIDDKNVANELDVIRKNIGLCPQENMHFSEFTVYEHLLFFSMIKGNSRKQACEEADELMKLLNIEMKRNDLAKTLSGGMKRKLSLAISLVGHSKVVILDEPTSGMDPQSRRAIWDHLLRIRGQRTILITTHFMEEADVLGDRIAIMGQGRVRCFGTSLYLKSRFGSGYQLKMLYSKPEQLDKITEIVTSQVSGAKLETSYRSLLVYSLPITSTPQFPQLFENLDRFQYNLGINSVGVAVSTLEDVFLSLNESDYNATKNRNKHTVDIVDSPKKIYNRLGGSPLLLQRSRALLKKKLLYTVRNWNFLILNFLIPILVVLYSMYLSYQVDEQPELSISLDLYPKSHIMVEASKNDWRKAYSNFISQSDSDYIFVPNIITSLLSVGYRDIIDYREKYLIASKSDDNNKITALYSTLGLHTIPLSIDMASNIALKVLSGSNDLSIKTINYPIVDSNDAMYDSGSSAPLTWMMIVPLGMTVVLAIYSQFPLSERLSNSKQVQFMAGVSPALYWSINFFVDFVIYLLILSVIMATIAIYDLGESFTSYEYGALMVVFILYGLASIWLTHLITFMINTLTGALNLLFTLNSITGLVLPLITTLLGGFPDVQNAMEHIFLLFPQYSLSQSLYKIFSLVFINSRCRSTDYLTRTNLCKSNPMWKCCECQDDQCSLLYPYIHPSNLNMPTVWDEIWYLIANILIFIIIIVLIETAILKRLQAKLVYKFWGQSLPDDTILDEDVYAEKILTAQELNGEIGTANFNVNFEEVPSNNIPNVTSRTSNISMLLADNLVKQYGRHLLAVKGVSFRVARGECFGLLGINGAGKTSTFKILTAEEAPTQGEAKLDGYLLSRHWNQYMRRIGYCPQMDPINEVMTGKETLTFYAQIRGKHPEEIEYEVNDWINLLGLENYQNALCGTYSGGNKRKLSTAIALIARPDIIFLDEPTSGVDPVSRRNLWNVVEMTKKEGKSLVLTSHSMEECEALCDRLGIMVAGQLKCLGPNQYLKEKFGKGYNVQLKMALGAKYDSIQEIKIRFENIFKGCQLKDEHKTLLQYEVSNPSITLALLFRTMEDLKSSFDILEDYSVSQTTLEQVFLSFAQDVLFESAPRKRFLCF